MAVKNYIKYIKTFFTLEFASAREYKFNFIAQSIGMIVNDIFWIIFWIIFFNRFDSVGGWRLQDMMLLFAVVLTSFGLAVSFFSNVRRLARSIENGALDYYLTLPKNILLQSVMKMRYGAVGDLLAGIVMTIIFVPLTKVPVFILVVVLSAVLLSAWGVFFGSLTFFFGRFEKTARAANDSILIIATNPFSVYSGWIKMFLLFVLPAGFIGSVPLELIKEWSWSWFGLLVLMCVIFTILAIVTFYAGLRRYESGNVISMKD